MADRHSPETDAATRHVGYYLIDEGRPELEAATGYRAPWDQWLKRFLLAHPRTFYFGGLAGLTLLLLSALAASCWSMHAGLTWTITLVLFAAIPISEFAVSLMNFIVPWLVPPRVLPKLDHHDGTPSENPTFVVIPSLVTSHQSASGLVERLEVHYLSNADENLFFGLLTDFEDADAQTRPRSLVVLLAHTGGERVLPVVRPDLADPRVLATPLEIGVTVIAAHCATVGGSRRGYWPELRAMFDRYPNLYADISAVSFPGKIRCVRHIFADGLTDRIIHGSDFPVPIQPFWAWFGGAISWQDYRRTRKIPNPLARDIAWKRAAGFPDAVFTRLESLLRKPK
jgi:hypothetical protein